MQYAPVSKPLPDIRPNVAGLHRERRLPLKEAFANTFQKVATGLAVSGHGKYCPAKNELLVRNGRKIQRFACGNHEIRVVTPTKEEAVYYCAPDATARELKRFIIEMIASMKQ